MPAAQQTHVDITHKVPCKAMLQRLELMALDEPSAPLLISSSSQSQKGLGKYFNSEMSSLHWKSKLRNVWGQ